MSVISEEVWSAYMKTVVDFALPAQIAFTVSPAPRGTVGDWPGGVGAPVFVLTAWNPGSERPGEEANRSRQEKLETEFRERGLEVWSTIGRDPESDYFEVGIAVCGLTEDEALAIGVRYGQDAIFSWTPTAWLILSCVDTHRHESGWFISGFE